MKYHIVIPIFMLVYVLISLYLIHRNIDDSEKNSLLLGSDTAGSENFVVWKYISLLGYTSLQH